MEMSRSKRRCRTRRLGREEVLGERLCCDSYPRWMALTEPRIYFSGELRGKICYSLAFPSFSHCSTSRAPYFILTPPIPKQIYLQAIFNQPPSLLLLPLFASLFFISSLSIVRRSERTVCVLTCLTGGLYLSVCVCVCGVVQNETMSCVSEDWKGYLCGKLLLKTQHIKNAFMVYTSEYSVWEKHMCV